MTRRVHRGLSGMLGYVFFFFNLDAGSMDMFNLQNLLSYMLRYMYFSEMSNILK